MIACFFTWTLRATLNAYRRTTLATGQYLTVRSSPGRCNYWAGEHPGKNSFPLQITGRRENEFVAGQSRSTCQCVVDCRILWWPNYFQLKWKIAITYRTVDRGGDGLGTDYWEWHLCMERWERSSRDVKPFFAGSTKTRNIWLFLLFLSRTRDSWDLSTCVHVSLYIPSLRRRCLFFFLLESLLWLRKCCPQRVLASQCSLFPKDLHHNMSTKRSLLLSPTMAILNWRYPLFSSAIKILFLRVEICEDNDSNKTRSGAILVRPLPCPLHGAYFAIQNHFVSASPWSGGQSVNVPLASSGSETGTLRKTVIWRQSSNFCPRRTTYSGAIQLRDQYAQCTKNRAASIIDILHRMHRMWNENRAATMLSGWFREGWFSTRFAWCFQGTRKVPVFLNWNLEWGQFLAAFMQ